MWLLWLLSWLLSLLHCRGTMENVDGIRMTKKTRGDEVVLYEKKCNNLLFTREEFAGDR